MGLQPIFSEYSIDQFVLMFKSRQINLDPGFQRRSVWSWSDRQRLIQSIVAGYPVPSVFLYKRHHGGRLRGSNADRGRIEGTPGPALYRNTSDHASGGPGG